MKVVIVIVLFDTRLMWILSSVLMSRWQHYTKSHQYGSKTSMLFLAFINCNTTAGQQIT